MAERPEADSLDIVRFIVNETKRMLAEAFEAWVERHRNMMSDRWYRRLRSELNRFRRQNVTIPIVAGFAMWVFNVMGGMGVVAGVGPDGFTVFDTTWERGFDRQTTNRLLLAIMLALKLMSVPPEVAKEVGVA